MNENEVKEFLQRKGLDELESEGLIHAFNKEELMADDVDKYEKYFRHAKGSNNE